jgi:hypothetical protein
MYKKVGYQLELWTQHAKNLHQDISQQIPVTKMLPYPTICGGILRHLQIVVGPMRVYLHSGLYTIFSMLALRAFLRGEYNSN